MLSKEEFKIVFDNNFDAIRNFAFYRCEDTELASDVAQDVFIKIWEKRASLSGTQLKPLLCKMTTDCLINHYRKKQYRVNFEQSLVLEYDSEPTPEDEHSFSELVEAYAQTLEQMAERQRTIFLMSREEGMKYAEIADYLNVSVKTVEKQISAALQFLRTKLIDD